MRRALDLESLRTVCGAIAASDFDVPNRVKSIAQVAHEYLSTSSIVVYQYSRVTRGLEILAMPGVAQPELMRGPADKLAFAWNDPRHGSEVWMEDEPDYSEHMSQLKKRVAPQDTHVGQGDFRAREAEKHHNRGDPDGRLATAKIYLRKGIGQTNDEVGQVFFNVWRTASGPAFSPAIRGAIRFVSNLIRELLIDRLYHEKPVFTGWAPEQFLVEMSTAFGRGPNTTAEELEEVLARIIRRTAMGLTQNFSGTSDFVLLIGRSIGRFFAGDIGAAAAETRLIPKEWITTRCIREKRYFVANIVERSQYPDFPPECRSAMIIPVIYAGEVRAVIRLTSPVRGFFIDAHAKAMQTLDHLARFGVLRLDERRQREQISAALDFYIRGATTESSGGAPELMKGVLEALGADWGTFWPFDQVDLEKGLAVISRGTLFERCGQRSMEVSPRDPKVGIRLWSEDVSGGFTEALFRCNSVCPRTFFVLHVVELANETPGGRYELEVFKPVDPAAVSTDRRSRSDDTCPVAFDKCEALTKRFCPRGPIGLDPSDATERHTRVAFIVYDGDMPRGVAWLKFADLRDIAWWERRYIEGISRSVGRFLRVHDLELAMDQFWHDMRQDASNAKGTLQVLITDAKNANREDWAKRLRQVETYMLTILWKSFAVDALSARSGLGGDASAPQDMFGTCQLRDCVERAIDMAVSFQPDRRQYVVRYDRKIRQEEEEVSALFYLALVNLLRNIHHATTANGSDVEAVIWIRKHDGEYTTCVANTGDPLTVDPFEVRPRAKGDGHGLGLYVIKDLLKLAGGRMCLLAEAVFRREHPRALKELDKCHTFFEFAIRCPD